MVESIPSQQQFAFQSQSVCICGARLDSAVHSRVVKQHWGEISFHLCWRAEAGASPRKSQRTPLSPGTIQTCIKARMDTRGLLMTTMRLMNSSASLRLATGLVATSRLGLAEAPPIFWRLVVQADRFLRSPVKLAIGLQEWICRLALLSKQGGLTNSRSLLGIFCNCLCLCAPSMQCSYSARPRTP